MKVFNCIKTKRWYNLSRKLNKQKDELRGTNNQQCLSTQTRKEARLSVCPSRRAQHWRLQRAFRDAIDWLTADASGHHNPIKYLTELLGRCLCKITQSGYVFYYSFGCNVCFVPQNQANMYI